MVSKNKLEVKSQGERACPHLQVLVRKNKLEVESHDAADYQDAFSKLMAKNKCMISSQSEHEEGHRIIL